MMVTGSYAWFGIKANNMAMVYLLGVATEVFLPGYGAFVAAPLLLVFGWARDTDAANEVWIGKNKGPIRSKAK